MNDWKWIADSENIEDKLTINQISFVSSNFNAPVNCRNMYISFS